MEDQYKGKDVDIMYEVNKNVNNNIPNTNLRSSTPVTTKSKNQMYEYKTSSKSKDDIEVNKGTKFKSPDNINVNELNWNSGSSEKKNINKVRHSPKLEYNKFNENNKHIHNNLVQSDNEDDNKNEIIHHMDRRSVKDINYEVNDLRKDIKNP